jgi:signal transduction histidine kinase
MIQDGGEDLRRPHAEGEPMPVTTLIPPRSSPISRHLEVLQTVAAALASLDLDEIITTSLSALTHVTGHEISSLHLLTPDGSRLLLRGDRGLSEALRRVNESLPVGQGLVGGVAASGQPRRLNDATRARDLLPVARQAVVEAGVRSFVCVPVRAAGRVLGTLSLGRRMAAGFTDGEVALLQCVADEIGLAVEHARLHAETQRQLRELERAQQAVVKAERLSALSELTRGVAHEINNPLTIILGQVQLALHGNPPAEMRTSLETIERAARRAASAVRDMRLFAEPSPAHRALCQAGDHVKGVLAREDSRLRADHVAWHTDIEDVPPVWADAGQLDQVLLHLVDNARHAMATAHGGGALTVRVRHAGLGVRVEVADDGPGIAAAHLPRIFDPFFTTKGPDHGRGLGLSVSHGIVREHGGRVWAENRPDGGAVVIVELPLGLRSGEVPGRR